MSGYGQATTVGKVSSGLPSFSIVVFRDAGTLAVTFTVGRGSPKLDVATPPPPSFERDRAGARRSRDTMSACA